MRYKESGIGYILQCSNNSDSLHDDPYSTHNFKPQPGDETQVSKTTGAEFEIPRNMTGTTENARVVGMTITNDVEDITTNRNLTRCHSQRWGPSMLLGGSMRL